MRKSILLLMTIILVGCSKISPSNIQGNWYVNSILTKYVDSSKDSGWKNQIFLSPVFHTEEILTIKSNVIIPCPSAENQLEEFNGYSGAIEYTLSETTLRIPDVEYIKYVKKDNGDIVVTGTAYKGVSLNVETDGKNMTLTGTIEEKDNLGNLKSRTNIIVDLTKTNLTNKDI